jgi:TnpA family transposase
LPRYFGRERGLTHYAFVSDQHTHFATRVIRTTVRDATHALDGILDNRSQLPIRIHSTDTAGYSDIIFALFDLLGLQFAPRLAGLPDTRLWVTAPVSRTARIPQLRRWEFPTLWAAGEGWA